MSYFFPAECAVSSILLVKTKYIHKNIDLYNLYRYKLSVEG